MMKLIKILGLAGAVTLGYWPAATMAAMASASATIDWGTLNISTSGVTLSPFSFYGDNVNASASQSLPFASDFDSDFALNWTGISADVMLSQAEAHGTTTGNQVDVDTLLITSPGVQATAGGNASRWGQFTVAGSGTVTFSVNYTGLLSTSGNSFTESVGAVAGSYLNLFNLSGGFGSDTTFSQLFMDGSLNDPNTLTVSLFFNDGDTGLINAGTYAEVSLGTTAPVPVPAALWLMASALVGLGAIGRRKSEANN